MHIRYVLILLGSELSQSIFTSRVLWMSYLDLWKFWLIEEFLFVDFVSEAVTADNSYS